MAERRCPTTEQVQVMIDAAGGANIKSGIKAASAGSNSVTFNTPFASIPRVILTVQDSIPLRDCLYQVTAVSATGFSFKTDAAAIYAWIATDAGDL